MSHTGDITQLLHRAANGESAAANQLLPVIYQQLHVLARRQLYGEQQAPTLSATALVNEAYLLLFGEAKLAWQDRGHFFAYAAKAMRNILIDHARQRLTEKRGGHVARVDIADIEIGADDESVDLLALDQVLMQMAQDHPRLVQVVELRFFAGLSVEDAAESLAIDARSVKRDWQKARAYIHRALERSGSE